MNAEEMRDMAEWVEPRLTTEQRGEVASALLRVTAKEPVRGMSMDDALLRKHLTPEQLDHVNAVRQELHECGSEERAGAIEAELQAWLDLSLIHISEPTRPY
eukprot:TRINITY_DN23259_c0_g1_i1.p1 TRINITY_DN23259_c0_g1~~TRINITY_DN23259_c0_g1_i1.p1  ORF type:complete len:102 (-),score=40.18 TRINITY_DN23259_c0_g1_i1:53-358(-)